MVIESLTYMLCMSTNLPKLASKSEPGLVSLEIVCRGYCRDARSIDGSNGLLTTVKLCSCLQHAL